MIAQNNQLESNTQRAPRYAYLSGFLLMVTMLFATAPNGFQYDLSTDTDALLEGNWLTRGQWGPVYLIAAYLVWRHRTAALQFIRQRNPFRLGLISLMLLSALWSPLPEVTIRRGGLMVAALLIGFSVHLAGW